MKYFIPVFLLFTSFAFADTDSTLKECSIVCSSKCRDFAEDLKSKANDVLEACNNGSGKSDIIDACTKVGFSYQSDVQECIQAAGSGEGVTACAKAGFSYQSDIKECIRNIGSKDADIVSACKEVGFSYQNQIKTCIASARYAADVRACAKAGFSYQDQILQCIGK